MPGYGKRMEMYAPEPTDEIQDVERLGEVAIVGIEQIVCKHAQDRLYREHDCEDVVEEVELLSEIGLTIQCWRVECNHEARGEDGEQDDDEEDFDELDNDEAHHMWRRRREEPRTPSPQPKGRGRSPAPRTIAGAQQRQPQQRQQASSVAGEQLSAAVS